MEHSLPITGNKTSNVITRFALPYMLLGGIAMIVFFLILKMFGLHMITELRWFNFLLMAPVIALVNYKYINTQHGKTYLESLALNFITFMGAFMLLAIFMFLYLSFIDPGMMKLIRVNALPELQLTPFNCAV